MKNKEELEIIRAKREKYENKHMGKFRKIFPWNDTERQEKYNEILQTSSLAPVHPNKKLGGLNIQKSNSLNDEYKKNGLPPPFPENK